VFRGLTFSGLGLVYVSTAVVNFRRIRGPLSPAAIAHYRTSSHGRLPCGNFWTPLNLDNKFAGCSSKPLQCPSSVFERCELRRSS